jgi:hypothetical protein
MVTRPGSAEVVAGPHFVYDVTDVGATAMSAGTSISTTSSPRRGKNDLLDKYFKGSAYTATWFLCLKGTGTAAVGDTLASHAGWAEVTPYSGNRPGDHLRHQLGGVEHRDSGQLFDQRHRDRRRRVRRPRSTPARRASSTATATSPRRAACSPATR